MADYKLLRKHRVIPILGGLILVVFIIVIVLATKVGASASRDLTKSSAQLFTKALQEFRALYTTEVVNVADNHGVTITHDYKNNGDTFSIPLPATFSILLGEKIGENVQNAKAKLYSPYPFPWRVQTGGLKDNFSKSAWEYLQKHPDSYYSEFTKINNVNVLRYATADILRVGCVGCHNSHPDTPKSDWKLGEVRGVLEIIYPESYLSSGTQQKLSLLMITTGILLVIIMLIIYLAFKYQTSKAENLKLQVKENTKALDEAQTYTYAMEQKLLQAQKMEAIGSLAAGLAHEINTPTQYIVSNLSFLKSSIKKIILFFEECNKILTKDYKEPEQLKTDVYSAIKNNKIEILQRELPSAIDECVDGTNHISKIIHSIKEYSHPSNSAHEMSNVNEIIANLVELSKNEWKYIAEVKTNFAESIPSVSLNSTAFSQVILNLIVNAANAIEEKKQKTNENGIISIETQNLHNSIKISVSDTGCGIPDKIKNKIYDPFFTTKQIGKGTGQGLAVVYKHVVDTLKGNIYFNSKVDEGTTFIVELPCKEVDE